MTDNELAAIINQCWDYAKTSGHHACAEGFERWFKNRARTLYRLNENEIAHVWAAALKMHS
jgi:hypothetical protein